MVKFNIIVAVDSQLGIGKQGKMPWHISGDMRHFKEITCQTNSPSKKNAVVMGRRTWESLPEKFRPLPGRINIVLSRNPSLSFPESVFRVESLDKAFNLIENNEFGERIEAIFIIGGGDVYRQAIARPDCENIYLTEVQGAFDCDVFFPSFKDQFQQTFSSQWVKENSIPHRFLIYSRLS